MGQSNASKDAVFEHKRQNYNSIFRNKPAGQKKVEREKKGVQKSSLPIIIIININIVL